MSQLKLPLLFGLALLVNRLPGADAGTNVAARLAPVPPCPALVAAAQTNQIPLEQMDPPDGTNLIHPGDSFTALVTLNEKSGRRTQWLFYLEAEVPDPKGKPADAPGKMVIYNTFGNKLEFLSAPILVSLRTLGPFVASEPDGKPPATSDKSVRFTLDEGFLGLGLDEAAIFFLRMKQFKLDGPVGAGTVPYSDATVRKGRQLADALKITPAEEHALGGIYPALLSYFSTVDQVPGLEAILIKVADMPSIWSILRHGGISSTEFNWRLEHLSPANVSDWKLPAHSPVYYTPMVLLLNGHRTLDLTLAVTRPQPPLLACGGIVGLLAESPGDKETFLTLRIISAHHSTGTGIPLH